MKQSKIMSLVESVINIAVGFGVGLLGQMIFLPLLGVSISFSQNIVFALIMTVISIARSYLLRRLFEALHIRRPLTPFMHAVIAERYRQIEEEGWALDHDDKHDQGELAQAGGAYVIYAAAQVRNFRRVLQRWADQHADYDAPDCWPWTGQWWKPVKGDYRRNLVKGCALIVADGDRFDRNRKSQYREPEEAGIETGPARFPIVIHHTLAHGKSASEQGGASA